MTKNRILQLLALAILCVLPAFPAIVVYDVEADWLAAATQVGATVDFSIWASTPGSYSAALASIVYADPGVTFTAPGDPSVQVNYAALGGQPWYTWGTGAIIHPFNQTNGVMQVDLTAAATAFAANMMIPTAANSMTVTVKSGTTTLYTSSEPLATLAQPTPTFFGVVSTDPLVTFNSILFTPTSGSAMLDNVRVGSYNSAPEPDSVPESGTGFLALGGSALITLGCFRKRR